MRAARLLAGGRAAPAEGATSQLEKTSADRRRARRRSLRRGHGAAGLEPPVGLRLGRAELMALAASWVPTCPSSSTARTRSAKASASGCRRSSCPRLVPRPHAASRRFPRRKSSLLALTQRYETTQNTALFVGAGSERSRGSVVAALSRVAASTWMASGHARAQARMTGSGACVFAEFDNRSRSARRCRPHAACPGRCGVSWRRDCSEHPLHDFTIEYDSGQILRPSHVGESPSWLRHRILIPAFEGSNPSSPASNSMTAMSAGSNMALRSNG